MNVEDISKLEQYLMSEDKLTFINSLVEGSCEKFLFQLIHSLSTNHKLSEQQIADIQADKAGFLSKYGQHHKGQNISPVLFKNYLFEFVNKDTKPERKLDILEILKNYYFDSISFYTSKPSSLGSTQIQKDTSLEHLPTQLDQKLIEPDYNKILNSGYDIKELNPSLLTKIDILQYKGNDKDKMEILSYYLQKTEPHCLGFKIIDICKEYLRLYKIVYKGQEAFPYQLYSLFTTEQLIKLGEEIQYFKKNSLFNKTLFQKIFNKKLALFQSKQLSDMTSEEKVAFRQLLIEIMEWTKKNYSNELYSLYDQLFYQVLIIDLDMEQCNKELFIKFLEYPRKYNNSGISYNQDYSKVIKQMERFYDTAYHSTHNLRTNDWPSDYDLVTKYLNFFFTKQDSYQEFTKFLTESYLKKLLYMVRLHMGEIFLDLQDVLTTSEIEELTKAKEITICNTNKQFYKQGDQILLSVDIKNIPNLSIKVFQIDTENYYLKNLSKFDNQINLEGINPLGQKVNIQQNIIPIIKKRYEFAFEELSQIERGIFVIEFMGNGISSRAVIRKGGLAYIEKSTLTGHILTLISENQQICKPTQQNHTGVWIQGNFVKANEQGNVIIPFAETEKIVPIVLVHNQFADLTNLKIKTENYQFKCAYLYNEESFLRGNKGKIIIQPRLYINNMSANMKILEDMSVTATLISEQGIPSTYQFKQAKFEHHTDIEIEVPVQNLVKSVEVNINGRIKKMLGSYQNIHSDHKMYFELYDTSNKFVNIYLRQNAKIGYTLHIMGKNGEPFANQPVTILAKVYHKTSYINFSLKTDQSGTIILGHLDGVDNIRAEISQHLDIQAVSKLWQIKNTNKVQYPQLIKIIEGDQVILPALTSEISNIMYSFYEYQEKEVLENCLQNITYDKNRIIIQNLRAGAYKLFVKPLNQEIRIEVIKGKYWKDNSNYIVNEMDNSFLELTNSESANLAILGINYLPPASKKENLKDIEVKLMLPLNKDVKGVLDMIRVHVFGLNFCVSNLNDFTNKLQDIKCQESFINTAFGQKKSAFLNNKQLGDEICYVIDRQTQQKFIGNTLEKPQILLKRTLVRDTDFEKENLEKDKDYKEGERFVNEKGECKEQVLDAKRVGIVGATQQLNDSMLNFLSSAGFVKSNLRPTKDGVVIVPDFPLESYSNFIVIVSNYACNISEQFAIDSKPEPSRDLRQKSQLNLTIPYCEKRSSVILRSGEKSIQKSDAECVIIDNIPQLFDIQKEVKIAQYRSDTENGTGYIFWDFLKQWPTLSQESKLKKYDEYACHELNIYFYMKDREFFDKIIKPFIKNKIEKTFVDYYLLNEFDAIKPYAQPQNISKLNYMEQILLIQALIKQGFLKEAQQIVTSIEGQAAVLKVDTNVRKKLFDTVISAKAQAAPQNLKMKAAEQEERKSQMKNRNATFGSSKSEESWGQKNSDNVHHHFNLQYQQPQQQQQQQQQINDACFMVQESIEKCFKKEKAYDSRPDENLLLDEIADIQIEQRKQYKPGYQKLKKTKEYIERTYYGLKTPEQTHMLINLNLFWSNLATYLMKNSGNFNGFLSENFIYATKCHAEMICALSFMHLNYDSGEYDLYPVQGRLIQIVSHQNTNLIIFQKDIVQSKSDKMGDIAVSQRIFDPIDRYTYLEDDSSIKIEKNITEYIINKVYGCQVIITNCSIADLELQILTEIPNGAIPIHSNDYTKSYTKYIQNYHTELIEYFFYFPQIGQFTMYPANVSRNEIILSTANSLGTIEVKKELTQIKLETFYDILRNGNSKDILKFIAQKNIRNSAIFNFNDIYWLVCDNKEFYQQYIAILKERFIFDYSSWSYSLHHNDIQTFLEFMNCQEFQQTYFYSGKFGTNIKYFKEGGLQINQLKIYEYYPLLSSRTHNFQNQQKSKILNIQFKQTYNNYLQFLFEVPKLEPVHLVIWCYYLLLQERIEETIQLFKKIDPNSVKSECQIQYDYLSAYLDMYIGQPEYKVSRDISNKYLDYPILSWRNLFVDLHNQLQEYDGVSIDKKEQVGEAELNKNIKASEGEESFTFELDNSNIVVSYQNLKEIEINYYELDLEILFSRTPFLISSKSNDDFSFVKANLTQKVQLKFNAQLETYKQEIPKELANKNLFIQVKGQSKILCKNYFSTSIKVQIIENYGQVKVYNQKNQSISKVYVKVFAKQKNGEEVFYRDGYTDMRGKFDYALSSNNEIDQISSFALFITHEEYGSIIKEVKPPSKLNIMEQTLNI